MPFVYLANSMSLFKCRVKKVKTTDPSDSFICNFHLNFFHLAEMDEGWQHALCSETIQMFKLGMEE